MKKISDIFPQIQDYYFATADGQIYSEFYQKYLKIYKNKPGYCRVRLKTKDNQYKDLLVHRIIFACFSEESLNENMVINHIDENKDNNSIENLSQINQKQNCNHGKRNIKIKLTKRENFRIISQLTLDGKLIKNFKNREEILSENFSPDSIYRCCKNYKHYNTYKGFIWKYAED